VNQGGLRLTEDDRSLLAMASSGMKMSSIAMTMGWSEKRAVSRLAKLKADAAPKAITLTGLSDSLPALLALVAGRGLLRLVEGLSCVPVPKPRAAVKAKAPPPKVPGHRVALVKLGKRSGIEVLRPMTPSRLRFARWFHEADWPVDDIAALFDLSPGDLAKGLGVSQ
jgi:hypothetical protein